MDKKRIKDLHDMCQSGEMSRESYWTEIQGFLDKLTEFASLQKYFGNNLTIQDEKVIVNIKATQTHKCRVLMVLDQNDIRSVPFSVLADGFYEPFQSDILLELGINSKRFFDIGANMGFYSLALAIENPNLSVVSFEPQPEVFKRMLENIELNKLGDRIKLINVGLGRQADELTMYIPRYTGTGGGSFKNLHGDEGKPRQFTVPVVSLDSMDVALPDLVKIDVEGFELNVITGAQNLLAKNRPTIMAELLRKWMKPFGHSPQMFLEQLRNFDYRCFAIKGNSLAEIDQIDEGTIETNFIFVQRDNYKHLGVILKYVN
jgi:FkbM family methyltransferase